MGLEELLPGRLQQLADCGRRVDAKQGGFVAQVLQVCSDTTYEDATTVFMILSDTSTCLKVTLSGAALDFYEAEELCIGKLVEVLEVGYDDVAGCPLVSGLCVRDDLGRHPTIGSPRVIFSAPSACSTAVTEAPLSLDSSISTGKWGNPNTDFPVLHSACNTPAVSPRAASPCAEQLPTSAFDVVSAACISLTSSVNTVTMRLPPTLPPTLQSTLMDLKDNISYLSEALDALSQKLSVCSIPSSTSVSAPAFPEVTPSKPFSPLATNLAMSTKRARLSTGRSRTAAKPDEKKRSKSIGVKCEKKVKEPQELQGGIVMPVKQPSWIRGKLYAPSEDMSKRCERQLKLSLRHVLGYKGGVRGLETVVSGNLAATKKDLVYAVSGVVVLQSLDNGSQRFFVHHNDDVSCLAQHPSRRHVFATSSLSSSKPQLVIWDSNDVRKPYRTLPNNAGKGVLLMCFSRGGLLATISLDSQNTLTVWDWLKEQIVGTSPTGKDSSGQIKGLAFSPYEDRTLITYGTNHLRRWSASTTLTGKLAVYGKKGETQSILCHHYFADKLLVGTSEGSLLMFTTGSDGSLKLASTTKEAHKGPVLSMCGLEEDQVATGGRDSSVILWAKTESGLVMCKSIPLVRDIVPVSLEGESSDHSVGGVASMVLGGDATLYLGTTTNKLFKLRTETQSVRTLQNCHSKVGDFRALAAHPTDSFFITGADDRVVKVWRHDTRQLVKEVNVKGRVRALCYSPDGMRVAVGYASGCWEVFCSSLTEGSVFSTFQQRVEVSEEDIDPFEVVDDAPQEKKVPHAETGEVTVLEYSPDSNLLAVGYRSSCVDVFKASEEYVKVGTCRAHHGAVRSIDWSDDSTVLQVATTSHEVLHFTSGGVHLVHPRMFKDVTYHTWTSPIGWCTLGLWDGNTYGNASEVTSVAASHARSTMIASDVHGRLLCTAFPLTAASKSKRVFRGHSPMVSRVCASQGDTLLSIGNTDRCVFVWAVA